MNAVEITAAAPARGTGPSLPLPADPGLDLARRPDDPAAALRRIGEPA